MKNKVIWITGASSGIGAACASSFSKAGAKIILSARSAEKLEQVKENLSGEASVLPFDVTRMDTIQDKCNEAISIFGQVDVLVNNAGISQRSRVEDTDLAVDRRIFELNYFGNIAVSKAILPHFLNRQAGNLVIISSVAGKVSTPGRSSYAASKHALHGYYDALRAEVEQRGVSVNIICPGYIQTDISLHALKSDGKPHGQMDPGQAKGMPASECADRIVSAVRANKKEVYIGGRETMFVKVRNLFPGIYYNMAAKMAKEERY